MRTYSDVFVSHFFVRYSRIGSPSMCVFTGPILATAAIQKVVQFAAQHVLTLLIFMYEIRAPNL